MKRRSFLWYSFLFLTGCAGSQLSKNSISESNINAPEKLRFAVTDISGLDKLEADFGSFRTALAEVLGIPIEFVPVNNFVEAAPALLSNEVDLVFAGPSEYLILRARAQAVPIVAVTRPDYYSMMMVKADSGITALTQLKGQKISMRTQGSTAGHIGASQLLIDAGLDPTSDVTIVMLGNQGLEALMNNQVAAWADSNVRMEQLLKAAQLSENDITIIAQGDPLPNDVFVANVNLDPQFIEFMRSRILAEEEKLMQAILQSPPNDRYQKSKMVLANDTDYDALRQVYKALNQESLIQ
jgi:phosphonate transport system substrate-binding protein